MMIHFYINYDNRTVIDYYLRIIKESFDKAGFSTKYITDLNHVAKTDYLFFSTPLTAFRAWLKGYRRIMLWQQGLSPEESFMRNKSYFRLYVYNFIERFVLKRSCFTFMVSEKMKQHYENKYSIDFKNKYFIMPCFNTELNKEIIESKKNHKTIIFTYIGSLAAWQCFDETLQLYKKIEDQLGNTKLKIFTKEIQDAEEKIKANHICNYEVDFVDNLSLASHLQDVKFGFLLRKDTIVNSVSTPTKLSTYLSAGVIPIFSSCIASFNTLAKDMRYAYSLPAQIDIQSLLQFCREKVDYHKLQLEYEQIFQTYYNRDAYESSIVSYIKKMK